MNEVLRDEYIADCERAVRKWNKILAAKGSAHRLCLPSRRFHRRQGLYAGFSFDPAGNLITAAEFAANASGWLLGPQDEDYLISIMKPVREPGKFANWIAPPAHGLKGQAVEFEYVRNFD
jgi:benzoyl-CoA 2,3-dioxygenase component B